MLGEVPEGGADAAPGGIDARDDDEKAGAEQMHVRDRLAFNFGRQEAADEVVRRLLAAGHDLVVEERDQLHAGRAAQFGVRQTKLEEVAHPAGECVGHVLRDAEHGGDDTRRDLLRVVDGGIGSAVVDYLVD